MVVQVTIMLKNSNNLTDLFVAPIFIISFNPSLLTLMQQWKSSLECVKTHCSRLPNNRLYGMSVWKAIPNIHKPHFVFGSFIFYRKLTTLINSYTGNGMRVYNSYKTAQSEW